MTQNIAHYYYYYHLILDHVYFPVGSPSRGGDVAAYILNINQLSQPTPFLFCSFVCFCLYGSFNCISFHKFSRQLSAFLLCSSGPTSVLLVLSTVYLFIKVSLSPDVTLCGWLGWKHQLTLESRLTPSSMYLLQKLCGMKAETKWDLGHLCTIQEKKEKNKREREIKNERWGWGAGDGGDGRREDVCK